VSHVTITTQEQLERYCGEIAGCGAVALDTEFVSERTYRPLLCLIQVASQGRLALIDALAVRDLRPFWRAIAQPGHETVVHAGRGEVEFCLEAVGRAPAGLFDVQIAAGLAGIEYPSGYGALLGKLLGESPKKHEARTDWRHRPLSSRQIEYALDDIRHLPAMRDELHRRLAALGRLEWLADEMALWQEEIQRSLGQERWRRVSGNSGLDRRSLAVVRELWRWRDAEAARRDCPARRVQRDDLVIELARRQSADPKRIAAVRGLERPDLRRQLPHIAQAIQRALQLPEDACPPAGRNENKPQLSVLGQFLFSALGSLCREMDLAPGLVGSPNDVRDWIACRSGQAPDARPPLLARGWRAKVIGRLFDDLLAGRLVVRIGDPTRECPLLFEPIAPKRD
jgi:ribonuclease D